ncbi:hypothetical protein F511_25603 [Dorcoceras hygrometricum]|uniref:Uncharacterized protein n=1 Tax=Dorcoceras hygrometricum TaxID=472368 RepID=A0A2Z7C4B7_9LAMI|nr:hypothetical protein F511_25603 [Dorcoceras hygrometricum]
MRSLPREWDVKTMTMRESKDLNKLEIYDLFADLKAYVFEFLNRSEEEVSTSQPPKRDDKKSSNRRRDKASRKTFKKKNARKVLVAEESNNKWADTDSESSTSSNSSRPRFCTKKKIHWYKKLSKSFEEVKAERKRHKDSADDPSCSHLGKLDSLETELTSVIYDTLELVKYDDQNCTKLKQKGKQGIGYAPPENTKLSWPKNRLNKNQVKSDPQSSDLNWKRLGQRWCEIRVARDSVVVIVAQKT